jgi:hypothetical protein
MNVQQEPFTRTEPLRALSDEELGQIIERCEAAIASGDAAQAVFEDFVLAQRELARRTWP